MLHTQTKLTEPGVEMFSHSTTWPKTYQICQNYFTSVKPWVGFQQYQAAIAALVFLSGTLHGSINFFFAGTFGCLYKGSVRGLSVEQPRKKYEVSIKALQGKSIVFVHISCHVHVISPGCSLAIDSGVM